MRALTVGASAWRATGGGVAIIQVPTFRRVPAPFATEHGPDAWRPTRARWRAADWAMAAQCALQSRGRIHTPVLRAVRARSTEARYGEQRFERTRGPRYRCRWGDRARTGARVAASRRVGDG